MVGAMLVPAWQRVLPTATDGIVLVVWTIDKTNRQLVPMGWESRTDGNVIVVTHEEGYINRCFKSGCDSCMNGSGWMVPNFIIRAR